ncbi:anti-sigma factor family protein [Thermoactinomyces mirandus]|uniref:Anti-sigma-W factor RsiW n=1 Tax=Thermoactinomyces mirandus TaxID=2756294 RepID=A0A7W1XQM3_9BACL|nr:anti-sigma factor [Thermoactinomyces mirandus]MBA4601473.1 zf-HC2 domain-containing protein [Thermoactinomyces mirandus]
MNSDCKEMEFLIQLYVDGEMKRDDRQRLEKHLNECKRCRDELVKLEQLVSSLEQLGERERLLARSRLLKMVKWAVVIASIILFFFASPFHANLLPPLQPDQNERKMTGVDWRLKALTKNNEASYILQSHIIQHFEPKQWSGVISGISGTAFIYPGAVPVFIKRASVMVKQLSRPEIIIFRIPNTDKEIQKWYDNWTNQILQSSY